MASAASRKNHCFRPAGFPARSMFAAAIGANGRSGLGCRIGGDQEFVCTKTRIGDGSPVANGPVGAAALSGKAG